MRRFTATKLGVTVFVVSLVLVVLNAVCSFGPSSMGTFATEKILVTGTGADAAQVNGSLTVNHNTTAGGSNADTHVDTGVTTLQGAPTNSASAERLLLKSTNAAQIRSSIQWVKDDGAHLFAMGNAFALGTENSFYIYNWIQDRYLLLARYGAADNSLFFFGPAGNQGGLQYFNGTSTLQLSAGSALSMSTTALATSMRQLLGFGTDPTVTACGGAGAGVTGEAAFGEITFGAGATDCTLNYPAYSVAPFCVFTPSNATAAAVPDFYISARGLTATTVTAVTTAGLPGASYTYHCGGDGD